MASCPLCTAPMVQRTAKKTNNKFLGCSSWPVCNFTAKSEADLAAKTAKLSRQQLSIPIDGNTIYIQQDYAMAGVNISTASYTIQQLNQEVAQLKDVLTQAKGEIQKRQDFIEKIKRAASEIGLVLKVSKDSMLVSVKGSLRQCTLTLADATAGDFVLVNSESGQPVEYCDLEGFDIGEIRSIKKLVDETHAEIETNGISRVILTAGHKIEVGDRVVVNDSGEVVLKNLGRDLDDALNESTGVSWDDIGGLVSAKAQMREAIELPYTKPEIFKKYGKKPLKGVLLYGPPGCGKTMLGKAAATAIAQLHGSQDALGGFIYVKGPEVLDKFVGESESKIRRLFDMARAHKKKTGFSAVLFVDEAEALLASRGGGYTGWSNALAQTIVPTFLAEMDGLEETGAMVLLATNRPDILDPAVVREGRIDRKIEITRPTKEESVNIFSIGFRNKPLAEALSVEDVSAYAAEATFSCSLAKRVSGSLAIAITEEATSFAINRELAGGSAHGISIEDVQDGIDRLEQQNKHISAKELYL